MWRFYGTLCQATFGLPICLWSEHIKKKKKELIAQAVAAMELQLDIIESTESQKIKLQAQYDNKLSELQNPDPKLIAKWKWIDDLTNWPYITLGNIF